MMTEDLSYEEEMAEIEAANDRELEHCGHIAIVSISDDETQCMDCLRTWPKEDGFVSDFPQSDRG